MTLVGCPDDAGEHLLGVRAVASAIATADLADDDGGPDGLFGAPVGRVDRRVPEKSQHRGEFDGQMGGESFGGLQRRWLRDQPSESGEQSAAGGRQTMVTQPPASRRSRNSRAACRTAFTRTTHRLRGWSSCRCLVRRSR